MQTAKDSPTLITRAVTDLLAGMTEQGMVKLYRRLTGIDMGSVLDYAHIN